MRKAKGCFSHSVATLVLGLTCLGAHAEPLQVVTEDSSYSFLENGKVAGAASKIVEMTLARAGLDDYSMTLYPWARAYDIARLEPNVLIYPIIRSQEREPLFNWIGELEQLTQTFYRLRSRRDIVVNNLADAANYTVGVVRDDARQQYLESKGFHKMVVSANNMDNLRKLLNGQIVLLPMPEREAREQCAELHIPFEELESVYTLEGSSKALYIAMSASTPPQIVQRVTAAYKQLKDDGTVAKVLAQ